MHPHRSACRRKQVPEMPLSTGLKGAGEYRGRVSHWLDMWKHGGRGACPKRDRKSWKPSSAGRRHAWKTWPPKQGRWHHGFYLRAAQERANRPRGEWGRLGVRVRTLRTARAAPGSFAIEWFTRRWVNKTGTKSQTFTTYLRRGTGDRYPRSAFTAVAQPWELELAESLEERFAEIRRLARSVSRVRMAFRLHAKLERAVDATSGNVPVSPGTTERSLPVAPTRRSRPGQSALAEEVPGASGSLPVSNSPLTLSRSVSPRGPLNQSEKNGLGFSQAQRRLCHGRGGGDRGARGVRR